MLQRAASNAYSWWLSSHIRTKQSKWLEQNLQDMEEKVHTVLKLIEEDGDSFARRAEMYYKKRPELIHFVEDSYRAYRALAERYDHISTELQNANRTIASVFPEQVQIEIDEEEEEATRSPRKLPEVPNSNIPSVPTVPSRVSSSVLSSAKKKLQRHKSTKAAATCAVPKSGLSKPEALEEIDKLQKQILAMQTEKEFLKSSYEHGLTKYREIDNQIGEMQGRVFNLQDEFGVGIVIEDGEARKLMASTALKSCEETLSQLQEKQARSAEEARVESNRIKETKEKFMILRTELHGDLNGHKIRPEKLYSGDGSMNLVEELTSSDQETGPVTQERQQLELLREKIKEHLEVGTGESLSVTEMVEKIDELVNKVISLETAVSSQTALVERLRTETNDLQAQIQNLEGEKATLIDGSDSLSNKLKDMEEKLNTVQDLNRSFENQNNNVHIHFSETRRDLGHLSEKLQTMNPDELELPDPSQTEEESVGEAELKMDFEAKKAALNPQSMNPNELDLTGPSLTEEESRGEAESKMDFKAQEAALNPQSMNPNELEFTGKESLGEAERKMDYEARKAALNPDGGSNKVQIVEPNEKLSDRDPLQEEEGSPEEIRLQNELKEQEDTVKSDSSQAADSLLDVEPKERETVEKDEPDWKQMFLNGIEDRERLLLAEYTTTLRSYKDVKKKLAEVEKRSQDSDFGTSLQLKELKSANATKDEEIKALHRKINLLLKCLDGNTNIKDLTDSEYQSTSTSMDDPSFEAETETETSATTKALRTLAIDEEDINAILIDPPAPMSAIEEKLRMHIDELLEENLDFWLKFSTAFHQIQKCETGIKDLQDEIQKLEGTSKKLDSGSAVRNSLKSEARPIYKHLREIQTEITVWIENSSLLKDELQSRFTSLCNIQEEITSALKQSAEEEEFQFTSYQAAKFQGEVLNMKQENNKVADELQAGLDHVTTLQLDLEKTLTRLDEEFEFSESRRQQNSQPEQTHSQGRHRVPLRSFIFGVKSRKQKPSIFSCMNPAMGRKYPGATQQRL